MNILLVEPSYRSKFPPLGLMRLSTYHKSCGDRVRFVRGKDEWTRARHWDRIYVASLFTWELPRTADSIKFYLRCVKKPRDIFVGGVGVTLLPDYVKQRVACTVIEGPLDRPGRLGAGTPAVADLVPDYRLLRKVDYDYYPHDAYFVRITKGCIRSCPFCAVPKLEKEFGMMSPLRRQISEAKTQHGEKQHLIVMDNNILGIASIEDIIAEIRDLGFQAGAKRKGRGRIVDFNQGLDARLISHKPELAKHLASICLSPVRLGYDFVGMRKSYEHAIRLLVDQGFNKFTNYMLFNFNDTPQDLYDRMIVNANLNKELGIRITGFPMRFIPMDAVHRHHVAPGWKWRYLRGIQCVLLATRGLVSPNPDFIRGAFGETFEDFLEILSMPDRYIIYRKKYMNNKAKDWQQLFGKLSPGRRAEFIDLLAVLNRNRQKDAICQQNRQFWFLLEHYYPGGRPTPCE